MAHFKSVVTDIGAQKLAAIVAGGGKLTLTKAAVGSGRTDGDRAAMTALVKEETAEILIGDMEVTTTGGEYLFATAWLNGADTDNILPPPETPDTADTVHIHDVGVIVTNQEAAAIEVKMGLGGMATAEQLEAETQARVAADATLQEEINNARGGLVIIPHGEDIPVEQRKEGFLYFRVSE